MIWDLAIPTRHAMMMDFGDDDCPYKARVGPILQSPPAIAQVCQESRRVALKQGGMIKVASTTSSGYTWFQSDRDFILDADMATEIDKDTYVERIVLEQEKCFVCQADDDIAMVTTMYNVCSRVPETETIYIAKEKFIHVVHQFWDPSIVSEIFNGDSIIVVGHDEYDGPTWARLNEIFSRESTKKALKGVMEPYWNSAEALCENRPEEGRWPQITHDILEGWPTFHEFSLNEVRKPPGYDYVEDRRWREDHVEYVEVVPCCVLVKSDIYPEKKFKEGMYWRERDMNSDGTLHHEGDPYY